MALVLKYCRHASTTTGTPFGAIGCSSIGAAKKTGFARAAEENFTVRASSCDTLWLFIVGCTMVLLLLKFAASEVSVILVAVMFWKVCWLKIMIILWLIFVVFHFPLVSDCHCCLSDTQREALPPECQGLPALFPGSPPGYLFF